MTIMDNWDIVLLVVVGYVAVTSLVRLMRHRRDALVGRLQEDFLQEQQRKSEEEKAAEQQAKPETMHRSGAA